MGPSVLPGLLHCIRVGHLTLALERKAGAIGEILSAVKAEWAGLGKALDDMARRAQTLSRGSATRSGATAASDGARDRGRARSGPRPTGYRACRLPMLVLDAETEEDAAPLLAAPQPDGAGSGRVAAG